jgi:uncharacterized protein HemX
VNDDGNGRPNTVTQAVGQVANKITSSLGSQPILLVLVLLNAIMIGGAAHLLLKREEYRQVEREQLMKIIDRCADKINSPP